jgi:hypothetical protein
MISPYSLASHYQVELAQKAGSLPAKSSLSSLRVCVEARALLLVTVSLLRSNDRKSKARVRICHIRKPSAS